jgi:hypothetical protein
MTGSKGDRADLVRRLCSALDIALSAVESIDAPVEDDAKGRSVLANLAEKIVAEAAMLILCAASVEHVDSEIDKRIRATAELIIGHARNESVLAGICLEPGLARDHALAHLVLTRLGYPDTMTDRLLIESLKTGRGLGPERLPHRELEQEWLARLAATAVDPPEPDPGLPGRSMLGRPLDVLASTRDDIYAFTHAVMYTTDLGERLVELPRSVEEIGGDAEAALAYALDIDDFDLAAEVLLTWPMLRIPWSQGACVGFDIVASAADDLGFVPGPSFDQEHYECLTGRRRAEYVLTSSYHTNLVWGFLCAAALRPGCLPRPRTGRPEATDAVGDVILGLDPECTTPLWTRARTMRVDQRDAIASMLGAALLRRAVTAGRFGTIQEALRVALVTGLAEAPAAQQAAALLHRSTILATARQNASSTPHCWDTFNNSRPQTHMY